MTKGKMAFAFAGAAALLAGCETAPVREYGPAPVRERVIVRPTDPVVTFVRPGDRYFNPITRGWERPWPYGPYDTANWR